LNEAVSIHTLEARDNMMLEVMSGGLQLSPLQMLTAIHQSHSELTSTLAKKGIDYMALRSALVPSTTRQEACLVFDTTQIETGRYSASVFDRVLPLLGLTSSHSILSGDLLGHSVVVHERLRTVLSQQMVGANSYQYGYGTQFYLVYITNLSDAQLAQLHTGLSSWAPYSGYIDCTYSSWFKMALSTMLPADFILHRGVAISAHEDDYDGEGDINIRSHPFAAHSIAVRSIASVYFGLFLAYKIERPPFQDDRDIEFSLNALSTQPVRLLDMSVKLDQPKLA
jgi:hypothetical protein